MTTWRIISRMGIDLGIYPGRTEAEALDAMARDAGYRDAADAAEIVGPFEGIVSRVRSTSTAASA